MTLALQPPRTYGLREAYDRRVWRTGGGQVARDFMMLGLATAGSGFAYDAAGVMYLGVLVLLLAVAAYFAWTLRANLRRVRLLRTGPLAHATLGRARRVILLHEMFRSSLERTWVLPYTFRAADGTRHEGRVFICGCVRNRFNAGDVEPVAYDASRPARSLPLRLAVMVAPH